MNTGNKFVLEKITSEEYGPERPPNDWADTALLIPHESLRREISCMRASIDKLVAMVVGEEDREVQNWQIQFFCEWVVEWLEPSIHEHHDNEEDIYFPWIATKAEIPSKAFTEGHDDLSTRLDDIVMECDTIAASTGKNNKNMNDQATMKIHLTSLQKKIHDFQETMFDHLKEEEIVFPSLLRAHFTKEEEEAAVQKLVKKAGIAGLRTIFPSVLLAAEEWMSPAHWDEFFSSLPPPIQHLTNKYILPDHRNCVIPKRDAPFLKTKPRVGKEGRVKCCMIPFCCFPCIV